MSERKTLIASEGMVLTDGVVYGRRIHLALGMDENDFHEITEAEYGAIMHAKEKEEIE